MAAATSVSTTETSKGFVVIKGTCVLDPASIAAAGREEMTIAVPDAKVGDIVQVNPRDALSAGLAISHARVSAAGTISFYILNHSAAGVDQASGTWDWTLLRGQAGISSVG